MASQRLYPFTFLFSKLELTKSKPVNWRYRKRKNYGLELASYIYRRISLGSSTAEEEEEKKPASRPHRSTNSRPFPPIGQESPPRSAPFSPKTWSHHAPPIRLRAHRRRLVAGRSRTRPQDPRPCLRRAATSPGREAPQL